MNNESLFDLYFDYVKDTEPPLIFHRWSLIAAVAAFLGRQYYLPFGESRIFPNQYVMLIGNPGTRKSSAIKSVKRLLSLTGYNTFAADRTTKEKFLLDLEGVSDDDAANATDKRSRNATILENLDLGDGSDTHDGIPREVLIAADEFNQFAGSANLDFLSMLGVFWDWDDENIPYKQRLKNTRSVSIYQPTVTLLGGNTHQSLKDAIPTAALGQGFLSRVILVHAEASGRKITFPQPASPELVRKLVERFADIRRSVVGQTIISKPAFIALDTIYRTWRELEDYRFKYYSNRRQTHLYKLCLVVSAMRCSKEISELDVCLANTILSWTENLMPKALGEFGSARHADAAHIIMSTLYETTRAVPTDELWKLVRRDLDKRAQLIEIISNLNAAEKIRYVKTPKEGWLPIVKRADSTAMYVDYKLLKEAKL